MRNPAEPPVDVSAGRLDLLHDPPCISSLVLHPVPGP